MLFKLEWEGPFNFYNDTVQLYFDREAWKYYRVDPDGVISDVDGVTTPIHIIDKSDALTPWAAKMVVEKAQRIFDAGCVRSDDDLIYSMNKESFAELMAQAKTAPKDKLEDAGLVGAKAHNIIERAIKHAITYSSGKVLAIVFEDEEAKDDRVVNCVQAAFAWMQVHSVVWHNTERRIFSRQFNYAGTLDGLCTVDDQKCIADWKTSNYLYPEYAYQTAAYQQAYQEETHDLIEDRWILRLGKLDGKFEAVHLPGFDTYAADIECFVRCLGLYKAHRDGKERFSIYKKLSKAKSKKAA